MQNQENEINNGSLPWFGIPKLFPFIKKYIPRILFMVLLGMFASFLDSVWPLFNRYALDHFVAEGTLKGLGGFIALYVGLLILYVADNMLCTYRCGQVEMSVDRDLRNAAFNHLQELSFSYFNRNNVGYIHARVMSDTGKIGLMVAWRLMDIVWNGAYIVSVLIMMFVLDWKLAIYIALLVPVVVLLVSIFQKKLVVLNRQIREINSTITGNFNEGITGARAIKTLVIEEKIQKDFEKDTERMRRTSIRATHFSAFFTAAVTMMSSVALALVLWRGGLVTIADVGRIGTLSVFLSYAMGMMEPIQHVIVTLSEMISIQVNIERLTTLLNTASDVSDSPEVLENTVIPFIRKKKTGSRCTEMWSFRMYPSTIRTVRNMYWNILICRYRRVRMWRSLGRPVPANPRWSIWCAVSLNPRTVRC